jgi:hypothetical protein
MVILMQGTLSELVLATRHHDYTTGHYSLNITSAQVIHVGQNINSSLSVGDSLDVSPLITSNGIRVSGIIPSAGAIFNHVSEEVKESIEWQKRVWKVV